MSDQVFVQNWHTPSINIMYKSTNLSFAGCEQILSERIILVFRRQLEHNIDEINCSFLENHLVIIIKQALTKPELLLIGNGHEKIAKSLRSSMEEILRPELKTIIEEVTEIRIAEIIFATHFDTNRLSLIALFSDSN